MSMRSTTPKKGLFDNIIKDLEQDKAKYSNTPRKSLSFSVEDKENFRFTLSDSSPSQTGDRDRTFQIDHLKETYGHSTRGKAQPRRSVDAFRDLGDSVNNVNMNINAASIRTERPPLKPNTTGYLQGNTNKLRMREKLKKLKISKAELTQVVKEIEMEKMKVTELKQSIFGDIRKSYDEFVKKDEMKLKEDMNRCLAMINELQELELGTEINLEKFNSILDEDISSMEEALKKYESIEIGKYKPSNLDLKLIEKERLEELENEVRAARNETKEIKESSDKFRQLHETSIQLNQILTQKAEDLAQQLEKTEVLRRDHKTLEDEWRRQEDNYEASLRQLERERDELRDMVDRAQDTANFNLKRELEKQKTNFADELWQINGFIKRIGLNLTQEFPVKLDQEGELNSEQLVQLVRQNLNELGKAFEKGLERERNRLEAAHKEQEKVLMEEYNKYKENLNTKIESEKDELKDALTQNFKKKTDELLQETWALKSQISSMVASEEHQKLKQALEEKEIRVKELEDEKKNLPQKIEAEVIRRTMEVRRDNLTSMGLLKDKHEKELMENAEQFKEMYENMLEQERAEGAQLREENQFLTQELESANKQIFELMKYKADYADLESERRKLEEKNFTSNEMRSIEYENKLKALQENNDKTIKFLEDKLEKVKRDSEREKYEVKETVDQLRSEYEAKIEELRVKYQAKVEDYRGKMEAFGKFKEGHERSVGEIAGNLRNIKEQLAEREQIISAKDREIQGLTNRLEHFEQENRGPSMQSLDRSLKPLDSSRMKQKRIMNQIIEKVNNLGEVLSGHARTAPGTVKSNVGNQDIRPLYQIGKELEILTKELDNDLSLTEDFGTDSMTEKSFDLLDAQKEGSKLTYKMLNMSDSSKSHQRKTSGAFHDPSKSGDQNKQAIAIQADFKDDSIFPPFDHRVCLRCRKNDLTSPSYCKYANIQKLEDLSFQSQKSSGSYKVSKNHIYGTNVAFKSKIEPNPYANFRTKGMMVHCVDKAVNTIISNNDFASKDASMGDEDLIELLTPKTETKRQTKIEMR